MNIRIIGIDGLGGDEVKRLFSTLTDFDFIKSVGIREFQNIDFTWNEVLNTYDVTVEIKPDRGDVSIHVFDNAIYIFRLCGCRHDEAFIYIDRSAYERLEII